MANAHFVFTLTHCGLWFHALAWPEREGTPGGREGIPAGRAHQEGTPAGHAGREGTPAGHAGREGTPAGRASPGGRVGPHTAALAGGLAGAACVEVRASQPGGVGGVRVSRKRRPVGWQRRKRER